MKFGKSLPRNQVPEWSSSYIDYKGLKKLIKNLVAEQRATGEADLAPFFFELDRNLENVDSFFNKRLFEAQRRLKLLRGRYGEHFDLSSRSEYGNARKGARAPEDYGMDTHEIEELLNALLELRSGLRKIQWYGEVNRRGFVKILKKVDKKTNVCAQRRYLESKVAPKPFASASEAIASMQTVNIWLSKIGGIEGFLEDDDTTQKLELAVLPGLRRVSSGAAAGISPVSVETVDQCIRQDDSAILAEVILEAAEGAQMSQKLALNLLQRAITNKALACIDLLLGHIESLHEDDDINERNVIHRLVISIGRSKTTHTATPNNSSTSEIPGSGDSLLQISNLKKPLFINPAESPISTPPLNINTIEFDGTLQLSAHDESVKLLEYLLDKLRPHQRSALEERDNYGRLPLHYAAQYGFLVISRLVIKKMREWGQFHVTDGIDSPKWQDNDGLAPLHLAVMGEHPKTTRMLLQSENWDGGVGSSETVVSARKTVSKSSAVLALATKKNAITIVKLLVEAGVDVDYQDENGETALHHAARLGHVQCAKALIEGCDTQKANVELAEKTYGWTPLFVAAVEGNLGVVEVLIEIGGSDVDKVDLSGWTAIEHAALRGHLGIARRLSQSSNPVETASSGSVGTASPPLSSSFDNSAGSLPNSLGNSGPITSPNSLPVKSFGHRYLKRGETMILVTLGSMDTRKNIPAVKLDQIPVSEAYSTQLDTALSLVVSAQNAIGEPTVIDLPMHSSVSTDDPIVFETKDASKVKLLFDIVPTYAGSRDKIIGRAVALLNSVKPDMGRSRVLLQGDVQVPILAMSTLEIIGCLNFQFLIVTPFVHPNMEITKTHTYWKSLTSPKVIGHRGLGKNFPARKSLQLGENTLLSFITAANLGASYVEPHKDVQLTKDHVPVIYHDFLVGETGIDAPVHTLTLDQFLSMSEQPTPRHSRNGSPDRFWMNGNLNGNGTDSNPENGQKAPPFRRVRSMSLNESEDHQAEIEGRMKHTRAFKKNGFKGNSRGHSIQGPFATLEQAFKTLPQSIGFNIELKYPMLQESEEEEMDTFVIEMNSWVNAILKVVYDYGKGRDLIFSSFNPDVCLMLSFKQPSIPILFLSESGTSPMADIRATSLQEAIRFASRWNLLGIVSAVEPLVLCPRLIKVVKESSLVCVTYGVMNNVPENVKLQVDQGVDAVIVDSVLAIRKGLTAAGHGDKNGVLRTTETVKEAAKILSAPLA
ncbi:Glycerophosphocholine phosphodiesterase [Rhizina undulata]